MSPLLAWLVLAADVVAPPSSDEILARVASTSGRRHAMAYSGVREYHLRNTKFGKEATVVVDMVHTPGKGKTFTVSKRSGSTQLVRLVERMLASETESGSNPKIAAEHEISPANYQGRIRGTEVVSGRLCYVIELSPKRKSKYLIEGLLWVEAASYGVVRIQGSPSASVSIWLGTPKITQEFTEVAGQWLPSQMRSVSTGRLLGTSELEIRYTGYQIESVDAALSRVGAAVSK